MRPLYRARELIGAKVVYIVVLYKASLFLAL